MSVLYALLEMVEGIEQSCYQQYTGFVRVDPTLKVSQFL